LIVIITERQVSLINYIVICISEFAERFSIDFKTAYKFLYHYGGIRFLIEHYDIEHTLGIDDAIDDLVLICRQSGGFIE
jgi:hypothetical protein